MSRLNGKSTGGRASNAASRLEMAMVGWMNSFKLGVTSGA
jgi:hypothetical protein